MSALDKERDDLLIFITSTITQMTKSPLAAQRTAAEKLYLPVKPYIGAARLANLQETAAIEGLLVDLDKAGMPEALAAINLTEVVAALKEKNKQYATLTEQRANAKADDPVESAKKIRLRMDEEYDEMSTYAFAQRGEAHSRDRRLHQPPQCAGRRDERPLQPTHSAGEGRSRQETRRRQARYRQRLAIRDIK